MAAVAALPLVSVLAALLLPADTGWAHLRETVLGTYVSNTLLLCAFVALVVTAVGVGAAWLTATFEFPGRRFFTWALILPLAAPGYVVAYVYADLLEYAGPVQSLLREWTGWSAGDYWFPAVRSLPGAALVLGFVLYPYVYLLCFNTFTRQSAALTEAARALGAGPWGAFRHVAVPVARPAIAGGVILALMETVADYGVVDFFGVPTFTSGVFRTWFALGEHDAALRLAGWLLIIVMLLVLVEHFARRGSVANPIARDVAALPRRLPWAAGMVAAGLCAAPLLLGIVIPGALLIGHAVETGDPLLGTRFLGYVGNTVWVAGVAALITTCLAVFLCYGERQHSTRIVRTGVRLATLGYAVPGMVLGVGLLLPLTTADRWLAGLLTEWRDERVGLLLTGSTFALLFVYVVRFLTVAFNGAHAALQKIHPHLDAAGRSLGAGAGRLLREVHLPLMLPAVLSSMLLVFIDVVKELPATLVLRPFNFETLATRTYRLASDERLPEASTAALAIVLLGLIPALMLGWQTLSRPAGPRLAVQPDGSRRPG